MDNIILFTLISFMYVLLLAILNCLRKFNCLPKKEELNELLEEIKSIHSQTSNLLSNNNSLTSTKSLPPPDLNNYYDKSVDLNIKI